MLRQRICHQLKHTQIKFHRYLLSFTLITAFSLSSALTHATSTQQQTATVTTIDYAAILNATVGNKTDGYPVGNNPLPQYPNWNIGVPDYGITKISDAGLEQLVAPGLESRKSIAIQTTTFIYDQTQTTTVDFYGDGLINFGVTKVAIKSTPSNGAIILPTDGVKNVLDNTINTSNYPEATHAKSRNGQIVLM